MRSDVPALDRRGPAIDGFRAVLAVEAEAITCWPGSDGAPEELHRLRIALRRSRGVLGEAKGVLPRDVRSAGLSELGRLTDLTGPARDLDVLLADWDRLTASTSAAAGPGLAVANAIVRRRRDRAHAELQRAWCSPRSTAAIGSWAEWLHRSPEQVTGGRRAGDALGTVLARRLDHANQRLLDGGGAVGPGSAPEVFHRVRKEAKRVRYLLECFADVVPAGPTRTVVKRLRALQSTLGELQDAESHLEALEGVPGCEELRAVLHVRRAAAEARFPEVWDRYDRRSTRRAFDVAAHALRR